MNKLKDFFKKSVCACKLAFAYVKAVSVLIKASIQRMRGDGTYEVSFAKYGKKWYCEVPGFPKELFEHTLMVGGAAKLLNHYAKDNLRVTMIIKVSDVDNASLSKNESTLTGGAFYQDLSGCVDEEIWLCPVTLFVLGKYPKNIQILDVNTFSYLNDDQMRYILNKTIDFLFDIVHNDPLYMQYSEEERRKMDEEQMEYLEETVVAEFNRKKSFGARITIVDDFAESLGFDWRALFK